MMNRLFLLFALFFTFSLISISFFFAMGQTASISGNQYVFSYSGLTNPAATPTGFGLYFNQNNPSPTRYEFKNVSGTTVWYTEALTGKTWSAGNLQTAGDVRPDGNLIPGGALQVKANKYAFQYHNGANPTNYGLFFNTAAMAYKFLNSTATPVFSIGANNGDGVFAGGLQVGNSTHTIAGNIRWNGTDLQVFDGSQWVSLTATATGQITVASALVDADDDTKVEVEKYPDEDNVRITLAGTEKWVFSGNALHPLNSGYSVMIGEDAGAGDDLSYNQNVFIGHKAGTNNLSGNKNIAIGYRSFFYNNTGERNTAIGHETLFSNSIGRNNTGQGYSALFANTTGNNNTATGYATLRFNTTGTSNTASGFRALYTNNTGNRNSAFGHESLIYNSSGTGNTASGYYALRSNIAGDYNTALGYSANSIGTTYTNSTGIGTDADPTSNNTVHIGNSSVTSIKGQVGFTTYSDGRFKTDVRSGEVSGLEFITKLKPVTYNYDIKSFSNWKREVYGENDSLRWPSKYEIEKIRFSGFIAQEVEKIAKEVGYDFSGVDKPKNHKDVYGLRYAEFVVPLVKAVQEQQQMIDEKNKQFDLQQQQINRLISEVQTLKQKVNERSPVPDSQPAETVPLPLAHRPSSLNPHPSYLNQNIPNPFTKRTIIQYNLPLGVSGKLSVVNQTGKECKSVTIKEGTQQITIAADDLETGCYFYSLIVNGKTIDTKKMVIVD